MASPTTSNCAELQAASDWKRIDFVSDLHLSSTTPRTLDAFASYLSAVPADAVMILGDLFDAWVGDDARYDGVERQVAEILTQASRRLGIYFLVGNRDFLLGSDMLGECGVEPLDDPTVLVAFGRRALLTHGDSLCLADHGYQKFRALVRQPGWQREFLRRPLSVRREEARRLRGESRVAQNQSRSADSLTTDLDAPAMADWLRASNTELLIHGHTHRPRSEPLGGSHWRHVLSDWDFDSPDQPVRGEVLSWEPAGLLRRRLESALAQT